MLASYEINFTDQATILYNGFKDYTLRFNATCPRDNEFKKMATDMIELILWYHRWKFEEILLGVKDPGPWFNIKTVLSTYGDFHVKDKTAVRTSYL